ncbi:MAG: tetratricopeptide repeat protein, partial [Thermoanaerobaculia bacterium]|nr:tetratricopeptide repeat protein [Thermoanaerobaculia bacterium]
ELAGGDRDLAALRESVATLPASPLATAAPRVTATLGWLYLDQGHRRDAARIFEQVLAERPGDARAREGLARARGRGGGGRSAGEAVAADETI